MTTLIEWAEEHFAPLSALEQALVETLPKGELAFVDRQRGHLTSHMAAPLCMTVT
jgi:hypothetical protein